MREAKANVPLHFILGGKNSKDGTKAASKRTKILLIYNKPVLMWQQIPENVNKSSALSSPFDWLRKAKSWQNEIIFGRSTKQIAGLGRLSSRNVFSHHAGQ